MLSKMQLNHNYANFHRSNANALEKLFAFTFFGVIIIRIIMMINRVCIGAWNAQNTLYCSGLFFSSLTAKLMLVCSLNNSTRLYYYSFSLSRFCSQISDDELVMKFNLIPHIHNERYTNIVFSYLCFQLQSSVNICECANMPVVHVKCTPAHAVHCTVYAK